MWLSDTSVKRPVFATVLSLMLIALGALSFRDLTVREYPDTVAPTVQVQVSYPGASSEIVETRVTQVLEAELSGIEGVKTIRSSSRDGQSQITVEFYLNRSLDEAIASAVTEYGRGNQPVLDIESARDDERLGFLAHEIRNLVGTATLSFEVLKTGNVGIGGSTGRVLERSLSALRDLINRSLAEARLRHDIRDRTRFGIAEFLAELAPAAALDAAARGLSLNVETGDAGVSVDADRATLAATVANLLQNAFKFTQPGTTVTLRASETSDRVLIEVEDECGGLPDGNANDLFQPFEQRNADRTGLGLGLAISRLGAEANNGRIYVRNLPDHGCIFTIDLPRVAFSLSAIVTQGVALAG